MTLVPLLLLAVALETTPLDSAQITQAASNHGAPRPSLERNGVSAAFEVLSGRPEGPAADMNPRRGSRKPTQLTNKRTGVTCTMLIVQGPEVDPGIHAPRTRPVADRIVNNAASPCVE